MRRILTVVVLVAAATGCRSGSTDAAPSLSVTVAPSPTLGSATPTVRPSRTRSKTPTPTMPPPTSAPPSPAIPPGVPRTYGPDDPAGDVPTSALIPHGSQAAGTWFAPLPGREGTAIVVTYARGSDPFQQGHGLVVWRRFGAFPHWRATVGFADGPRSGVLGIQVEIGDATADGAPDVLSFESRGGTGACGAYRVIEPIDATDVSILPAATCDTTVGFSTHPSGLIVTEAIFRAGDAHCCPSAFRISRLRWNGSGFDVASRHVSPAPGG
jgi:hypothetical protein